MFSSELIQLYSVNKKLTRSTLLYQFSIFSSLAQGHFTPMSVLFKSVNVSFLCVLHAPVAFSFIRDVPEYKDHQNKNKKKTWLMEY